MRLLSQIFMLGARGLHLAHPLLPRVPQRNAQSGETASPGMMRNRRCDRIGRLSRGSSLVIVTPGRVRDRSELINRLFYSGRFGRQMEKQATGIRQEKAARR